MLIVLVVDLVGAASVLLLPPALSGSMTSPVSPESGAGTSTVAVAVTVTVSLFEAFELGERVTLFPEVEDSVALPEHPHVISPLRV